MSDPTLREIDEELRREKTAAWLRRYGPTLASVVLAVVLLVGGYQGWTYWQERGYQKQADAFHQAIGSLSTNKEEALSALQQIASDSTSGYGALAALERAKTYASDDKKEEALAAYLAIADTAAYDAALRELSLIIAAYMALEQNKADSIAERMVAAATEDSIFPGLLKEWLAVYHLQKKETDKATALLQQIEEDATSPQALQYRAERMRHVILSQTGTAQ